MAGYFSKELFAFLADLEKNNDRDWFKANKPRYEQHVKEPFLEFITDLGPRLKKLSPNLVADPRPVGGSLFRIYRDVRFAKDKSPYKTHAGAHFQLGGKGVHGPGYYLHVQPGECFVAGGMWMPEADQLRAIRQSIVSRTPEWKRVRTSLSHEHDKLVRPPSGFPADHPMIEDIKLKSFTGGRILTDNKVCRADFMEVFLDECKSLRPLMKFLASAVGVQW